MEVFNASNHSNGHLKKENALICLSGEKEKKKKDDDYVKKKKKKSMLHQWANDLFSSHLNNEGRKRKMSRASLKLVTDVSISDLLVIVSRLDTPTDRFGIVFSSRQC